MNLSRRSGILLHPTSLPSDGGIGTLGDEAYRFIEFLESAGQSIWQVLPLGPLGYGNSPYSSYSAFAGNPLLIDLRKIAAEGDLDDPTTMAGGAVERVDYAAVFATKIPLLRRAATRFFDTAADERRREFDMFCSASAWLDDYALFISLKEHFHGRSWGEWPADIAERSATAVEKLTQALASQIREQKYMQWQFFRQWRALREYANSKGISIIGDIPIFVAYDSADVWSHPEFYKLDGHGRPTVVAGVAPDYFSETGQLWGNPVYRWDVIAEDGFAWWIRRLAASLALYNYVRIDHFRGFAAHWEVPATEQTAVNGEWVPVPGEKLFNALLNALGAPLPILAEDLGLITPDVEELRDLFKFPGMKVLHFAFGSGHDNFYLPHNYSRCCVAYTGTHDNNTTRGWYSEVGDNERQHALAYLRCTEDEVVWEMIRAAFASVAAYAVIPFQDLFELDAGSRMNIPGVANGNWEWRMSSEMLNHPPVERLRELTIFYNRTHLHKD